MSPEFNRLWAQTQRAVELIIIITSKLKVDPLVEEGKKRIKERMKGRMKERMNERMKENHKKKTIFHSNCL